MKINIKLMKKKINITENQQSQVPAPWGKKVNKIDKFLANIIKKKKRRHKLNQDKAQMLTDTVQSYGGLMPRC